MSDSLIEEVQKKIDLFSIVSKYVSLKKKGKNYVGLCPFHNETNPSFTVSPEKNFWYCFGCGKGGDVIKFISEIKGIPYKDALYKLAENAGIKYEKNEIVKKQEQLQKELEFYRENLNAEALFYLHDRHVTTESIEKFKIGFAQDEKRIVFPVFDTTEKIVGFIKRAISDTDEPRYKFSPFSKSSYLYNFKSNYKKVYVVEGVFDVILLTQKGFDAVATLGNKLSPRQKHLIRNLDVTVIPDADDAGFKGLKSYLDINAKVIILPKGEDPASFIGKRGVLPKERDLKEVWLYSLLKGKKSDEAVNIFINFCNNYLTPVQKDIKYELARKVASWIDIPQKYLIQAQEADIKTKAPYVEIEDENLSLLLRFPFLLQEYVHFKEYYTGSNRKIFEALENCLSEEKVSPDEKCVNKAISVLDEEDKSKAIRLLLQEYPSLKNASSTFEKLIEAYFRREASRLEREAQSLSPDDVRYKKMWSKVFEIKKALQDF